MTTAHKFKKIVDLGLKNISESILDPVPLLRISIFYGITLPMARLASISGWLCENKILTNLAIYETSSIAGV